MKIIVVTLFPAMIEQLLTAGIPRRAVAAEQIQVECLNPRDFTTDVHRTVDDRPYGGGPGMVMKVEPLKAALTVARDQLPDAKVVYMTPQGKPYTQAIARCLAKGQSIDLSLSASEEDSARVTEGLILVAGRYEGIDERLLDQEIDLELSIGDYVLSGGELAAMVIIDSIVRLLPGVLGSSESAEQDSFGSDGLLDCPHYTRPETLDGVGVPAVLVSGDHQKISEWRRQQSITRTFHRRPELLETPEFLDSASKQDLALIDELKS